MLNVAGTLTIEDSLIFKNSAARAGGGIETAQGSATFTGGAPSENTAGANPGNGGGLHLTGAGDVAIDRASVVDNTAANEGGGLWNSATGMSVERTVIVGTGGVGTGGVGTGGPGTGGPGTGGVGTGGPGTGGAVTGADGGSGHSSLPRTGSNANVLVGVDFGLLALGGAVMGARRKLLVLVTARN